jgi:hypothetical protein
MGFPDTAKNEAVRALGQAESVGHPQTVTYALVFNSLVHLMRREPDVAERFACKAIALSETHGFPGARLGHRNSWVVAGDAGRRPGGNRTDTECLGNSGEDEVARRNYSVCRYSGGSSQHERHFRSAIGILDCGLAQAKEIHERYFEAELCRLKAEYLIRGGGDNRPAAETCLGTAVEIARAQGGRSLELRALTTRAQLAVDQAVKQSATGEPGLREIYSWFTEGHETLDLKESEVAMRVFPGTKEKC